MHPEWNVLYGHEAFADAGSMLPGYLRKLVEDEKRRRSDVIANLRTPDELSRYQEVTRAKLREAVGAFPERNPLNPKTAGILERGDYAVEKVIFESRPRYYVTANIYVPRKVPPPYPAVLAPVGHWGMGKTFEEYQRLGIYLARRGYLVLVYDVPGQGERRQYYNRVLGRALIDPGTSHWFVTLEHGYAGGQAILTSGSYASYLLWDGIRALDLLYERDDVDRSRIACTGTSGGGLQTELLSALDTRIQISIPVCYGGCNPDNPTRPGLSITDVDALIVPRPLLLMEATGDSQSGVLAKQHRYEEIARLYELSGERQKTEFIIAESPHGYTESMYEAAYAWLSRWFFGRSVSAEELEEPLVATEPPEKLFSTASGEVTLSLGGETVFTLNRTEAQRLRAQRRLPQDRAALPQWRDQLQGKIRTRLGLDSQPPPLRPQTLARVDKGSFLLEKLVYYSDDDIFIPALLFLPKADGPHPGVVFINEGGKASDGVVEGSITPLVEAGYVVLSIDPRGMGETDPLSPRASHPTSFKDFVQDTESDLYYRALRVGKTLIGMRTRDVLGGVDYLESRSEVDASRISVIGQGAGGLMALYAAALDQRIRSVASMGSLISYAAVAENELYTHRFGAFGPGLLHDFDLPEVAALIAPRPLLLLNLVEQSHRVVAPATVTEAYQPAVRVYQWLGEPEHFISAHAGTPSETAQRYLKHLSEHEGRTSETAQ